MDKWTNHNAIFPTLCHYYSLIALIALLLVLAVKLYEVLIKKKGGILFFCVYLDLAEYSDVAFLYRLWISTKRPKLPTHCKFLIYLAKDADKHPVNVSIPSLDFKDMLNLQYKKS